MARPRLGRRAGVSRYLPFGYMVLALAFVAAVLPTALRPPQQPPSTSAELSPDAPPDDTQESIVAALRRGTSGTAGAGTGDGQTAGPDDPDSPVPPPTVPPPPPPRFCPQGFGDPPRQVESFYSAPCAGAWQGDNGGATWKNVSATEVRIGVVENSGSNGGMGIDDDEPRVIGDEPREDESAGYRTWRVYQNYFNSNFQLWGRHLRFVIRPPEDGDAGGEPAIRAAVQELDEEYHVFGIKARSAPALTEAARRELVGAGGWNWLGELYHEHQPYLTSWRMDGTTLMRINASYICKKLAGQPAAHAGAGVRGQPRRFGLITARYDIWGRGAGSALPGMIKRECGADMVMQEWSADDTQGQSAVATAIAQFRASEVTTIVMDVDPVFTPQFLSQSDAQSYFPEWYVPGTWALDESAAPFLFQFSRAQWEHAFGVSANVMNQYATNRDHYRAYKSIDPANTPADGGDVFRDLLQIVNGLQMAGPDLTPSTFREGLNKMGKRANDPPWSVGGGYGPGDPSYSDDVAFIWWDNLAPNPSFRDTAGAYQYVDCGRRHSLDAITADPPKVFEPEGTCIVANGPA